MRNEMYIGCDYYYVCWDGHGSYVVAREGYEGKQEIVHYGGYCDCVEWLNAQWVDYQEAVIG